jgi:hypothetical protein
MKNKNIKLFAFIILLMLFTVSCDLLSPNTDNGANLDSAIQKAVIETKAAATLEAWNAEDQDGADDTGDSDDQQADSTDVTPTDMPDATATPTLTPTATVPPTPTSPPGDPTIGLGDPTYEEDFSDAAFWWEYDDDDSKVLIQDNSLRFTKNEANGYSLWTASWPTLQDYYLDVISQVPGACSGKDEWGVLFRSQDSTEGHLFTITCDGHYRLRLWNGSDMTLLVESTESEHINPGSGAFNRIGVMAADDEISLYVNGFFLETINSSMYDAVGPYGVTINAVETDNLTVHFTELRYWDLTE